MKKLILLLPFIFLLSCSEKRYEIKQIVSYDLVSDTYSVTTQMNTKRDKYFFYNTYIRCTENQIDSVKKAEFKLALKAKELMN